MAAQEGDVLYTERVIGANRIPGSVTAGEIAKLVPIIFPLGGQFLLCLLYTSPSPRDKRQSRMPSSA